jgi:hypothetical protein
MSSDSNEHDDNDVPVRQLPVVNRGLLAVVSDLLADSVEHQSALRNLADAVRDSDVPIGQLWLQQLAKEIRRDASKRTKRADEIDTLTTIVDGE